MLNPRLKSALESLLLARARDSFMPEDAELKDFLLENVPLDEVFLQYGAHGLTYKDMFEYVYNGTVTSNLILFSSAFIGKGTRDTVPENHLMYSDMLGDGTEVKIFSVDLLTLLEEQY